MMGHRVPAPAPLHGVAPDTLKAPLFSRLVEGFRDDTRPVILDLGAPRAGTVSFFNNFRCRLDIADLGRRLDVLNSEKDKAELAKLCESALPARHDEDTDLVLCWDLLNYLERPALSALMGRIATRARTGTLVHALIVYASSRMPVRPGVYSPEPDPIGTSTRLRFLPGAQEERDAPRYSPETLGRCLSGYHLERAMLLGNGMQEFLYRL